MAALTAMAVIGLATSIGGTVWNAVQTRRAGKKQQEQANFNAAIAEEQADDAIARGKQEEDRYRAQVRGNIGTARAAFASQGVDVGSGSAADVQGDIAYLGELDALQLRNNAAREAWGYKVEARNYVDQGKNARSNARNQIIGSVLGTAGSVVQTVQATRGPRVSSRGGSSYQRSSAEVNGPAFSG